MNNAFVPNPERELSKQTAAAKVLNATLREITDDAEAIRDTVEGSTNLHEAIAAAMLSVMADEILVTGLTEMLKTLGARKSRYEKRIERQRAAVEQAMQSGELKTLRLPDCVLSLRDVPAKVLVTDETQIPQRFWKASAPVLDKAALNTAVKDGDKIPGAQLGNGSVTLSVRRA